MRWFKHMTASAHDEKLARLRDECGLAGYGFYWAVLEIIAAQMDESGKTFCAYSRRTWCMRLAVNHQTWSKLLASCAQAGLFVVSDEGRTIKVDAPKLLKYRDEYSERLARKEGQNRDKVPPLLTDLEKEEEELNTPPYPPAGGERTSANPVAGLSGREPRPELQAAVRACTGSEPLRQALESFRAMRERMRRPLTRDALKLVLRELDRHGGGNEAVKIAMLEQSVLNSWQGIFPLRPETGVLPRDGPQRPTAVTVAQQISRGRDDMADWLHAFRKQEKQHARQKADARQGFDPARPALSAGRAQPENPEPAG